VRLFPAVPTGSLTIIALAVTLWGCSSSTYLVDPRAAGGGRYSSAPTSDGWKRWPPPFLTIVMTHAQYEVEHLHHVVVSEGLVDDPTSPSGFLLLSQDKGRTIERRSETIRGTGIVIRDEISSFLILTCYHLVEFPQSVSFEVTTDLNERGKLLVGTGKRMAQQVFVGRPGAGQALATIVAFSEEFDLAVLRVDLARLSPFALPLPYDLGKSDDLRAGDGVYILGAPRGKFQVTWGIASPQNPSVFHVDTSTPPGYSGGAVLSTVRETGEMELVGIVTGTAGHLAKLWSYDETVLSGATLENVDFSHIVAGETKIFDFGITYCVSAEEVASLLEHAGIVGPDYGTLDLIDTPFRER